MRIAGFQPCTLIDYPGKVAAIVFTQGCPFSCGYCHNPELIPVETGKREEEEILEELRKRKDFLDGVVVTGGEPTVQPDLPEFLKKIKDLSLEIKLDTNGVHPDMIEKIVKEKLADFFAMDIKHVFTKYTEVVGNVPQKVVENCERTARTIARSGIPYEFRTTTDETIHSLEDIVSIATHLPSRASYALQQIRREKTLQPLEAPTPTSATFLERCGVRIREVRPDLHLVLRT